MKKILIADDEPNILLTLDYTFKKNNFQVFIARDGQEAIDILNTETPDVVLLDIMMPKVDGFETLKYIKTQDHLTNCKVIFLSAKSKPSDIENGIALGANAYITKPFSLKKILETVENI
jgi:two-component system, OmpR family, alkaline phosphatase synthesis response regulator PhoP